jgi:DNA-binding transcriptional MerR regulator
MPGKRRSAQQVATAERQRIVLELRKSGVSLRAIQTALSAQGHDVTLKTVCTDVQKALRALTTETVQDAAELRQLEIERLDMAAVAIVRQVQAGDIQAIHAWVKIIARRCELLGLDIPVTQRFAVATFNVSDLDQMSDDELSELAKQYGLTDDLTRPETSRYLSRTPEASEAGEVFDIEPVRETESE